MNLLRFQVMATILAGIPWPQDGQDPGRLDAELGDKLSEEVGELAKACRRHGIGGRQDWRGALVTPTTTEQVMDEVGDVLFVLARRAKLHGVDLEMAAERALAKFLQRLEAMGLEEAAQEALRAEGLALPPIMREGKVRIVVDLDPRLLNLFETATRSRDARLGAQVLGLAAEWQAVRDEAERQAQTAREGREEHKETEV